jgi:hypothetical protein
MAVTGKLAVTCRIIAALRPDAWYPHVRSLSRMLMCLAPRFARW